MILDVVTDAIPISGVVIIFPEEINESLEVVELGLGKGSEGVFLFDILEGVALGLTLRDEGVKSDEGSSLKGESAWVG